MTTFLLAAHTLLLLLLCWYLKHVSAALRTLNQLHDHFLTGLEVQAINQQELVRILEGLRQRLRDLDDDA